MNTSQFLKRSCSRSTAEARQVAGNSRGIRFSFQLSQWSMCLCGTRLPRSWQSPAPGETKNIHACGVSAEREGKAWGKETQKEAESPQGWHEELPYPGETPLHIAWSKFWHSQLSFLWGSVVLNSLSCRSFLFLSFSLLENNLISQTPIPHRILGSDGLDWFARFAEKTPTQTSLWLQWRQKPLWTSICNIKI